MSDLQSVVVCAVVVVLLFILAHLARKAIKPTPPPTAEQMAQQQLAEAERALVDAKAWSEHFKSQADMLSKRIARLRAEGVTLDPPKGGGAPPARLPSSAVPGYLSPTRAFHQQPPSSI